MNICSWKFVILADVFAKICIFARNSNYGENKSQ